MITPYAPVVSCYWLPTYYNAAENHVNTVDVLMYNKPVPETAIKREALSENKGRIRRGLMEESDLKNPGREVPLHPGLALI